MRSNYTGVPVLLGRGCPACSVIQFGWYVVCVCAWDFRLRLLLIAKDTRLHPPAPPPPPLLVTNSLHQCTTDCRQQIHSACPQYRISHERTNQRRRSACNGAQPPVFSFCFGIDRAVGFSNKHGPKLIPSDWFVVYLTSPDQEQLLQLRMFTEYPVGSAGR